MSRCREWRRIGGSKQTGRQGMRLPTGFGYHQARSIIEVVQGGPTPSRVAESRGRS